MSSTDVTINQINTATTIIVVAVSLVNFVLGGVGLIFNMLIFTRPSLRREPCSLYFLSLTCFNLFVVFVVMPVRIVSNGFNLDFANYNLGICKVEYFAFRSGRTVPCWLIVLACIDRYLHSSATVRIRQMSSLKTARVTIGITSIVVTILYIHTLVYYEIGNTSNQYGNIVPSCNGQKGFYRTFNSLWYLVTYSLCPSLLMLLFGFLTMKNLRHNRRIVPNVPAANQIARRTHTQLGRMLVAQVLVIIISTLPFSIIQLYLSITTNLTKSSLQTAQENLAFGSANAFTYFAHSTNFYLYTLTGTIFRKEFTKIIKRCWYRNENIPAASQPETHQISVLHRSRPVITAHITHTQRTGNALRQANN